MSHSVSCEGHRVFAWKTSILGSWAQRSRIFWSRFPPLQSPPYGTLVTSILLLSYSLPSITSPSLRTCFLLSLLNASPREMDEGKNILQRWKFLGSYGYDLVGGGVRPDFLFFFLEGSRLLSVGRAWLPALQRVLVCWIKVLLPSSHTHTHTLLCWCSSVPLFSLILVSITPKKLQIKGCDSRLEDEPERGRGALWARNLN